MELTKQDVVNNGWLTDVAIASDNKITLDSEILKAHITHPDVYNLLYTKPEPKTEYTISFIVEDDSVKYITDGPTDISEVIKDGKVNCVGSQKVVDEKVVGWKLNSSGSIAFDLIKDVTMTVQKAAGDANDFKLFGQNKEYGVGIDLTSGSALNLQKGSGETTVASITLKVREPEAINDTKTINETETVKEPEAIKEPETINEPEIVEELGNPVADDPVETVS